MKGIVVTSAGLSLAALTVGCGTAIGGAGRPVDFPAPTPLLLSPNEESRANEALAADVDMCTLFSRAELNQLGFEANTAEPDDHEASCTWSADPLSLIVGASVLTVELVGNLQDDLRDLSTEPVRVAGLSGQQIFDPTDDYCAVVVQAPESVLAGAIVTDDSLTVDPEKLCPVARRAAALVLPRLP